MCVYWVGVPSHTHRPHTPNRGITTEELDSLQDVLCLTERVAEQVSVFLLGRVLSHTHRPHTPNRGITTKELDGLQSVLCLTERVAEQVSVCLLGGGN